MPRSKEGENQWMSLEEIRSSIVADDFLEMLDIFVGNSFCREFFYEDHIGENPRWIKRFY